MRLFCFFKGQMNIKPSIKFESRTKHLVLVTQVNTIRESTYLVLPNALFSSDQIGLRNVQIKSIISLGVAHMLNIPTPFIYFIKFFHLFDF